MPCEFEECLGHEFLFYGCDNHFFKMDELIFEVLEDECDGYRSYLGTIEARTADQAGNIFFREPVAIVKVIDDYEVDGRGFMLKEDDGHVWLCFGTDESDSYYPSFYFNYKPKPQPPPTPTTVSMMKKKGWDKHPDPDGIDRLFEPRDL